MNFFFNLDNAGEPVNNNIGEPKPLSKEDIELIKRILKVLT